MFQRELSVLVRDAIEGRLVHRTAKSDSRTIINPDEAALERLSVLRVASLAVCSTIHAQQSTEKKKGHQLEEWFFVPVRNPSAPRGAMH